MNHPWEPVPLGVVFSCAVICFLALEEGGVTNKGR